MCVREGADNGAIEDENAAENSCGISKKKEKAKRITGERKVNKYRSGMRGVSARAQITALLRTRTPRVILLRY